MDSFADAAAKTERPKSHITIEPFDGVVTVTFSDAVIASTKNALVLREGSYDPVFYIPFKDIYFDFLRRSETASHCPHKGNAAHWSVTAVGESMDDVMWAYEQPYEGVSQIAGHGAFYPKKVRIEAVDNRTDKSVDL